MSKAVNIQEARSRLAELVERARTGEEIVISRGGRAVARIVALPESMQGRRTRRWTRREHGAPEYETHSTVAEDARSAGR